MLFQRETSYFQGTGISRAEFDAPPQREVCGFVLKGVKAEHIKSMEVRVNGLSVLYLTGCFDDEQGEHISAGIQAVRYMVLSGIAPLEGGGVPLIFGQAAGLWASIRVDGRTVHAVRLFVELEARPEQLVCMRCEWLIKSSGLASMGGR